MLSLVHLCVLCFLNCAFAKPPNIVFLLADDMGYGEVGVFPAQSAHGRIATPNIDRLASEGMRFTEAYCGNAVCAPSRCSLITGLHQGHAPIRGNRNVAGHDMPLPAGSQTIPSVLKTAGYQTALVGKWGLGYTNTTGAPLNQGFDYYFGQLGQAECHDCMNHLSARAHYLVYPLFVWEGNTRIDLNQNFGASQTRCMSKPASCAFSQDLFTDKALEYLVNVSKTDKPFFLEVSWTVPHAGGYNGTAETGAPVPSWVPYGTKNWPTVEKGHAAVITSYLDRDVGRVLKALDDLGLSENTVVIFASDNGAHNEGGHHYTFFNSSGPLRGFKRSLYEGGIRSPTIIRWPNNVPAKTVSAYNWAFWDVLPTLAEIGGAQVTQHTDGISIVPTLLGKNQPPKDYLYWEFCTKGTWGHAVRKGKWKAVSFSLDEPLELYNLEVDIHEDNNIAAHHPKVVAELQKIAAAAHTDDHMWPRKNCISSLYRD